METQARPLSAIAQEIKANWQNPYFGAVPYLDAMLELNSIHDNFGMDSADGIVRYFLGNARNWRGDVAKRIKTELNNLIK